jgi:hypothetical protein
MKAEGLLGIASALSPRTSVEGVAANAIAFIRALGLSQVDVLGFATHAARFWKLWPPDRMKLRTPLCYLDQGDKGGAARAKMLSHPNGGTPSNSAHTSRTPGVRRRSVLDLPRCDVDHQLKAELEQLAMDPRRSP